jgi:hypothetical protein
MTPHYQTFASVPIGFYPKAAITQSDFIPLNGFGFMATPAQLVSAISLATGVPLATMVDIDRKLVKGNLRTKGGRGFNAARMTPLDAARLLTAVLASPQANASVEAVQRYTETRMDKGRSGANAFGVVGLDDLAALPARHSFVDALAAVIASVATGSLAKQMAAAGGSAMPSIEIFAFTRATRGRIRIAGLPNGQIAIVEYAAIPVTAKSTRPDKSRRGHVAENASGDLEQSRRITERTILSITRILGEGSRDE